MPPRLDTYVASLSFGIKGGPLPELGPLDLLTGLRVFVGGVTMCFGMMNECVPEVNLCNMMVLED